MGRRYKRSCQGKMATLTSARIDLGLPSMLIPRQLRYALTSPFTGRIAPCVTGNGSIFPHLPISLFCFFSILFYFFKSLSHSRNSLGLWVVVFVNSVIGLKSKRIVGEPFSSISTPSRYLIFLMRAVYVGPL
uniref:Uncharacterized protein n=1 Tax=Rhizophora mucronata TaxID=61149 RepID=A0A2P2KRH4_RHIMU